MITKTALDCMVYISILLALYVFFKSYAAHRFLTYVAENENRLMRTRRTLKPQCLQAIRLSICSTFLYAVGAGLWLWQGDNIYADNFVIVISIILFLMTLMKDRSVSIKVIQYSQFKRLKTEEDACKCMHDLNSTLGVIDAVETGDKKTWI